MQNLNLPSKLPIDKRKQLRVHTGVVELVKENQRQGETLWQTTHRLLWSGIEAEKAKAESGDTGLVAA